MNHPSFRHKSHHFVSFAEPEAYRKMTQAAKIFIFPVFPLGVHLLPFPYRFNLSVSFQFSETYEKITPLPKILKDYLFQQNRIFERFSIFSKILKDRFYGKIFQDYSAVENLERFCFFIRVQSLNVFQQIQSLPMFPILPNIRKDDSFAPGVNLSPFFESAPSFRMFPLQPILRHYRAYSKNTNSFFSVEKDEGFVSYREIPAA